jgi:hypothetical protein
VLGGELEFLDGDRTFMARTGDLAAPHNLVWSQSAPAR